MATLDPLHRATFHFRLHDYSTCLSLCDQILSSDPYNEPAWLLKCKALTRTRYIDDADLEEEGAAEALMDTHQTQPGARKGTSMHVSDTSSPALSASVRPVSSRGFARPSTANQQIGTAKFGPESSRSSRSKSRIGSARAMTALGRSVNVLPGAAEVFIDAARLQGAKVAEKRNVRKAICDYLIYFERNPQKALEVAAAAGACSDDLEFAAEKWWWLSRLGKCYYLLGLYRDAERELLESIKCERHLETVLDLGKVYLRLDQPQKALNVYQEALESLPSNSELLLAIARVHDVTSGVEKANVAYRKVLNVNPISVEAIASLAANFFYAGQQEMALRFYQRLVQIGDTSAELWNNIAICSFYAAQYDLTMTCFHKALAGADDEITAEVMYNVGVISVNIGDLALAFQAFKVALSLNEDHAEAYNNLGILLLRQKKADDAKRSFMRSQACSNDIYEAYYNGALLAFKKGEIEASFGMAQEAARIHAAHKETQELLRELRNRLD